jgi:hypothetical protein
MFAVEGECVFIRDYNNSDGSCRLIAGIKERERERERKVEDEKETRVAPGAGR